MTKMFLKPYTHERPRLKDIYYPGKLKTYKEYFYGIIVYSIIVMGPCGLLMIPFSIFDGKSVGVSLSIIWGILFSLGIIWGAMSSIRLQFFPYLIIDKKMKAIEALRKSMYITEGRAWKLFGFFILSGFVGLLGLLFVFVGLFISIPVVMLASIFVYKSLLGESYKESETKK